VRVLVFLLFYISCSVVVWSMFWMYILHKKRSVYSCWMKQCVSIYRVVDTSLAQPGRKQANVSVRMAWISFGALPCRKKLDDSSRLHVVEIALPWHVSEHVSFVIGLRTYRYSGKCCVGRFLLSLCIITISNIWFTLFFIIYVKVYFRKSRFIYIYIYIYI